MNKFSIATWFEDGSHYSTNVNYLELLIELVKVKGQPTKIAIIYQQDEMISPTKYFFIKE